ncbi:tubulin epsilon chain [Histomonas meleagridis]|uniref:tubulin epsilon chain n=1 Tax=Histomonas meleagridis TaxID=135588 RepID=UPI00355AA186|nr:tubulin epsilon chain [Histomonas meleagridis]KAH0797465.1 tubulin epsilon chain [Histomonas meleagridis]
MSEIIFLQIGQAGNQIGWKFWEKALQEHVNYHKQSPYDLSYQSFFEVGDGGSFSTLNKVRARAVLIDTELNVTKKLQESKIGRIFQGCNISFDATSSANSWSFGYHGHGVDLGPIVFEKIRRLAENTDHLDSFFMLHSLGGGTGSGFGSYILENLADEYPKQWKMATVVTPSTSSDVVISPYNCVMSCSHLCQYADCVFPIDNSALQNYVYGYEQQTQGAYDQMNTVVANFLLDLTAGSRFSGKMNVDLREIETNMIPFPNHKFLVSGISPIIPKNAPRSVSGFFTEAMSSKASLCDVDPHSGTYLSNALLIRGDVTLNSIRQSIDKMSSGMHFPPWNSDGWKIGICNNPPLYSKLSVLCLTNTSAIHNMFDTMVERFNKLFRAKAYLKHYTDYGAEEDDLVNAKEMLQFVSAEYCDMAQEQMIPKRPNIIV